MWLEGKRHNCKRARRYGVRQYELLGNLAQCRRHAQAMPVTASSSTSVKGLASSFVISFMTFSPEFQMDASPM